MRAACKTKGGICKAFLGFNRGIEHALQTVIFGLVVDVEINLKRVFILAQAQSKAVFTAAIELPLCP